MKPNIMAVGKKNIVRVLLTLILLLTSSLATVGFAQDQPGDPNKQCRNRSDDPYQPYTDPSAVCNTGQLHSNCPDCGWFGCDYDPHWDVWKGNADLSAKDVDEPYFNIKDFGWTIFIWVEQDQNDHTDTICWDTVWVYNAFIKADAGPDELACDTAELDANNPSPGTGTWSAKDSEITFSNVNNPTATAYNLRPGNNILYWKIENSQYGATCKDSDSVVVLNTIPYPVDAGVTDTTCDGDSIRLDATPPPDGCSGVWSFLEGQGKFKDSTDYNTWVTDLAPGENVLQWKVTNDTTGCSDSDTVVIYNYTVHIIDRTDPGPWCTDYARLKVSVSPRVRWRDRLWSVVASTGTINYPHRYSTSVTGLQFGDNTFRFKASYKGCVDSIDVTIQTYFVNAIASASSPVCNDTTYLQGNDPSDYDATGHWETLGGGSVIDNSTAQQTFATQLVHGSNYFVWVLENSEGCSDRDTVEVLDLEQTDATITTPDGPVCDSVVKLDANPLQYDDDTGYWTVTFPQVTFSPDSTSNSVTAYHLQPGNNVFIWHVVNGICPEKTDTVVINYHKLIANAGIDDTTCTGDSIQLAANVPQAGETGQWGVAQGYATFSDRSDPQAVAYNLSKTEVNLLTWTISDGVCSKQDTVAIVNLTPTQALVSPDTAYTCNSYYNLIANSPNSNESGYWTGPKDVTYDPDSLTSNVTVTGLKPGINEFVWHIKRTDTCPESTDTIWVVYEYVVPDAGGPYDSTCNGSIQLNATLPPGTTGKWSAPSPVTFDNDTIPNAIVSNLQYGRNILHWTVYTAHGCPYDDTVSVYNFSVGTVSAGLDEHICQTYTTLSGTPPTNGSGLWTTTTPGVTIDDPTYYATQVEGLKEGANEFIWTVSNDNCSQADTVIIYNDSVSVAEAGDWQVLCSDSTQLNANSPTIGSGHWSVLTGSANFSDPTDPAAVVTGLRRGVNVLQWTISNEYCSNSDTVNIYNMSVDAYYASTQPVVTCDGVANLDANNPAGQDIADPNVQAHGEWSSPSGHGQFTDPNAASTTIYNLPLDTTTVLWTVYNEYCSDTVQVVVVNNQPEQAYAGVDTVVCSTSYILNATPPSRGKGHWVVIAGGGTIANDTAYNSEVDNLSYACTDSINDWLTIPGAVNIFEWVVDYNGCKSRDTVEVINGLPRSINAGVDTTVCSKTVNLDALDQGRCAQRHWWKAYPGDGVKFYDPYTYEEDSTDFNAHVEGLQKDTTMFVWFKSNTFNGVTCTLTDTVYIVSLGLVDDISAGQDEAICDTTYKLSADPPSTVLVNDTDSVYGYWKVIYGEGQFDDSTQYDTYVRHLGFMTNILRWTLVNESYHCIATDDLYLTNALPSNAKVYSNDTVVCENTTTLTANRPVRGQGHWEVVGGSAQITGDTCNDWNCRTYAHELSPGLNTFLWVVTNQYYGVETDPDTLTCTLQDTAFVYYNQVIADAGDTVHICADTFKLKANQPDSTVGQWSILGGTGLFKTTNSTTSPEPEDTVYNLLRGKNTLVWKLSRTVNGVTCSDQDQLIIWDNLPPNPDAGSDQTVCADSAYLTANPDQRNVIYLDQSGNDTIAIATTTQYWEAVGNVATFKDSTDPSTWILNLPPSVNTNAVWHKVLTFVDSIEGETFQCELTDTAIIYNNSVTAVAGDVPGQPICGSDDTGAYVVLNATPPSGAQTGQWTFVSGPATPTIDNPNNYTTGVHGLFDGKNIFRWTVSATHDNVTCSASDDISIEVRTPTTAQVAQPDSFEVCADTAGLQGNKPTFGVGHWEPVYPYSGDIVDSSKTVTSVHNLRAGITKWAWVIDDDGCISSDTITVLNNTVYADADDRVDPNVQSICVDTFKLSATDPNIFNNSNSPDTAKGYWSASTNATFDDDSLYNTVVRDLSNTSANVLTWTIEKGGCKAADQVVVYDNEFTIDAAVNDDDNIIEVCYDTLQLDGEQPGNGGHGVWTVINGGGNFDNDTLYNTVVRSINITGSNEYVWTVTRNGCTARDTVQVINNMVTSQAGPDQTICYDTTSMQASLPAGATGQWLIHVGAGSFVDASDPKTHVDNIGRDVNQYIWKVTKGSCEAYDTVQIVNNMPEDPVAEDDKEVCSDSTTLVVAVPPASDTGYWKLLSGTGTILDSTSYNAPVVGLQPGVNKFLWIVTKAGCKRQDTLVITNDEVAANAGLDDTVCADTARIAAQGPSQIFPYQGVGHWEDAGGTGVTFDNPDDSVTIARNLSPGINTLRWKVTLGNCEAYDDIQVVNRQVFASASDIVTCSMPVNLSGNDPVNNHGVWKNIGGLGTIANDTLYNSEYTGLPNRQSNVLRWIVYNESCADSVDILVTNNGFIANAGASQVVCADTAKLNAQLPDGATGVWSYDAGNATFDDTTNPGTIVRDLSQGDNILRWTVTWDGCKSTDTLTITNSLPEPAIITGPTDTVTCDSTATLTAQSYSSSTNITSKHWEIIEGAGTFVGDSTDYTVDVKDLLPGNNKILWIIENGKCADTAQIIITNNAVVANAGADQYVCDTVATLAADNPVYGIGHWETSASGVTIEDSTNNVTKVTGLAHGMTTFTWVVTNGKCKATDQAAVYNNQVFAQASDTAVCSDTVQLRANDPSAQSATGYWTIVAGPGSLDDSTVYNTVLRGLQTGTSTTLQWTVENGYCSDAVSITVTNNNFYVNAYPDTVICTDSITLIGTNPEPGTGNWKIVSAGSNTSIVDETNDTTKITGLNRGENKFAWIVTKNGCTNSDTVTVVNATPSDAIIMGDRAPETCDSTISFSAQKPTPYYATSQYWSVLGEHTFLTDSTDFDVSIGNLAPGQTQVVWTVVNGKCIDTAMAVVTNNAVIASAEDDFYVCDTTATIRAADPLTIPPYQGSGVWKANKDVTIADSTNYQTTVSGLPIGQTIFTWTVTKGSCSATDTLVVTNHQVFAIAYDTTTCTDSAPLIGNDPYVSGGTGKWSILAGDGTIENDTSPSTYILNLPYKSTVTLQWLVTNGFCSDSTTIQVVSNNFYVSAGINDTVCADTAQLKASDLPDNTAVGTWKVASGSGTFDDTAAVQTVVRGLAPGANTLQWTVDWRGCEHSDQVVVVNNEPSDPVVLTENDTAVCDGNITLRADKPTQGQGYWEQLAGRGLSDTVQNNIVTVSGLAPDNNVFRWNIVKGKCVKSQDINVINNAVSANAGPDVTICEDTLRLAAVPASSGATGYWKDVSSSGITFSDTTDPNSIIYNIPQQSTITLSWNVVKGNCSAEDYVQVTNLGVRATASNQVVCDTVATLDGNDPSVYKLSPAHGKWSVVGSSPSVWFDDDTLPTTNVNGLPYSSNVTLQWKVYNDYGCADSVQILITNNGFKVSAGTDQAVCDTFATLSATDPGNGGSGIWSIISGNGSFVDNTDPNTTVYDLQQGDNILQWKVTRNGCSDSAQVTVTNELPSEPRLTTPDTVESCDGTVALSAEDPAIGVGYWIQIAGTGLSDTLKSDTGTVSGLAPNANVFRWIVDNNGCKLHTDFVAINNQVISDAGANLNPCQDSVQLQATDPASTTYGGTGYWEDLSSSGIVFQDSTKPNTWVYNLPTSPVTLAWNVVKGSCPPVQSTIVVYNHHVDAIASSKVVCDDSTSISAAAIDTAKGDRGWWTKGTPYQAIFESDTTKNTVQVDSLASGINEFVWHVANDYCSDSVKVYITNNAFTVNADPRGDFVAICDTQYTLSADNPDPGYGYWHKISGPGEVQDTTKYNSTVTGLTREPTVLEWRVFKNGCSASDQVTIVNGFIPAVVSDTAPHACSDTVKLVANNPSPGTGYWRKLTASTPGTIEDSTNNQTYITGIPQESSVGLYWVVQSDLGNCKDSVLVTATNNNFSLSAGPDQKVCSDTAALYADDPTPGTGTWSVSYGNGDFDDANYNKTVVRNLNHGDNVFTWTVTKNGCTVSADVVITNNSVSADAGTDQLNLCVDSTQLNANDPSSFGGTGYWSKISGSGTFKDSTLYNTKVYNLRRGDNVFRWTVSANGCSDFDDVVIVNNSFDVNAGIDKVVCSDTAILTPQPVVGGSGHWYVEGNSSATIDNPDSDTTVVRSLDRGVNIFRWEVTRNGCTFSDDVQITNNLPSDPVIYTSPDTVCIDSVHLEAKAPETGETGLWTYTGSGGTIKDPTNNVTDAIDLNTGRTEFIWTLKKGSCSLSKSVTIINNQVTANAGNDQLDLCQNYTSLNAVQPQAPAKGWWEKADGQPGVIADTDTAVTPVTNLGYGINRFVWHVEDGKCSDVDTVEIINNSASPAIVSDVPPTCTGEAYLSATPPDHGTGQWSYIGTGNVTISSPNSANTKVSNLKYGANLFKWTITNTTDYATCTTDTTLTVLNYQFTIDAGQDYVGCDSITYLQGQTRPEEDSAYWTIVTGRGSIQVIDTTDPNSKVVIQQGGSAVLKWTVWEHGCHDEDYVSLENKGVTAVAFDKETCDSSTTLDAVSPGVGNHGYWTAPYSDITFSPSDTAYNANVDNLHVGNNAFTWHVYNDLCSDSVTVNINYLVPYAYAGSDQTICSDEYNLSANNPADEGGSGKWSVYRGGGDFDNDTLYNTTVHGLQKGENILTWTVTVRGCSNSDNIVLVNNEPFVNVDNNPMEICDTVATLTGNTPDTANGEYGYWSKVTPGPYRFEDSLNPTTKVYGIQPGSEIMRWTVVNGKCSAYADLTINNNQVQANAGNDIEICTDSVQLNGYLPSYSTGYWSVVTPGPTVDDSTLYNSWAHNLQVGDNVFRWTVQHGGCVSSDEVTITNNAIPVDAGDDQTICTNYTTLSGTLPPQGAYGVWRLVGGYGKIVDSTSNTSEVTDLSKGANVFSWTIYNGKCAVSDEVTIYNNEVIVDAGAGDPALCGSDYELNANPAGPGGVGHWQVIAGYGEIENPDSNITWVHNLARGENVLRWTVTRGGCTGYDDVVLNNITPSQAVTIGEKSICEDSTIITGNEPRYGVGHWEVLTSSSPNVQIADSLSNSTLVRNLGLGPNQFLWIITDTATGCFTSDTVTVFNNSVTAFAGIDREICVDTFKLEADDPAPNTGVWSTVTSGGKFDSVTDPHTIVRDLPVGVNILRWTVSNGLCSASDDVIITNNMTTVADAGEDQISCDGTATLIGNTPDVDEHGLWIRLSGTADIQDPSSYVTKVTGLSPGKTGFVWMISRGSCYSSDTVFVDNHQILVDAGRDREVCVDTVVLQGNKPTSGITGEWTLVGGSGTIDSSNNYVTTVRDLGLGANVFRWTLSDSVCSSYDEVVITNDNPTDPKVCEDTVEICQNSLELCANTPAAVETGYWTVAAGHADFEDQNDPTTTAYNLSKEVTLLWHIKKGSCDESDTMYIINGTVDAIVAYDSAEACDTSYWLAANEPLDTNAVRYWSLVSGQGSIEDSTASYTKVSGLGLGANTFRWTVKDSMCSSSADVVIVNSKYPVNANLAGENPVCDSSAVVLGSPPQAGGVGTWSVAAGSPYITFEDPHATTTTAYNLGNGTSILKWTVTINSVHGSQCSNSDTVVVINNAVYANAGEDKTVCDTTDTTYLIANDPATSNGLYGYWSVVSGSAHIMDTASYVTKVTNVAYGSNTLKWTVVGNGCEASDVVVVSDNHFTVSAGVDRTICDTTTTLSGTDPGPDGSGLWTVAGTGWFVDPTNHTTQVNGIQPGVNRYIWTVRKNGCTAIDTVIITNGTPIARAGGDKTVCEDSTSLDAVEPNVGSGVWSLLSGSGEINDANSPHTYVTGLAKGNNVFRWTVYNGVCSAYDEVTITNNMVTATAGVDQQVCDSVAYMAADPPADGGYGIWSLVAGGGHFDDSTLYNTRVTGLHTGNNTFRWTVYENGCSNSTEVTITNNSFTVDAGDDAVVTVPSYTLDAELPPGTSGSWSVIAGSGTFSDQNLPDAKVTDMQQGVNTYRWSVYNPSTGCSAFDDVNVIYNGFKVDAGPDQNICADTTQLAANDVSGAVEYWSVVQGSCTFDDPTDPHTIARNIQPGVNILRWNVTKNGFTTYDEVVIKNYEFKTDAGPDQALCDDSTQLQAIYMKDYGIPPIQDSIEGQWQFVAGGGALDDQTDPKSWIRNLSPGQNILRWYVRRHDYPGDSVYACAAVDTVVINYYKLPPTDFVMDPESGKGCNPLKITFHNTTPPDTVPGTVYYWNFANMSIVRANYSDSITRIFYNTSEVDSTYPVWLVAEANVAENVVCRDTVEKDVVVWAVPHAEFIISPTLIYPAANAYVQNLSSRNAQRYQWDFGDGTGAVQDTFVAYFTHDYAPAGWGKYTVTLNVWNEHCHSSDTATVNVLAPPPRSYPNVNTFKEGCQPLTLPLYPSVMYTTPGESEYKWIIRKADDGDTVAVLNKEAPVYTFKDPGIYYTDIYVTAEGTNPPWSWTYIRTDTVWVHPKPVADFTVEPSQVTVNEMIHCYNYSKGAVKYFWDFGMPNGTLTSTEVEPVISYPQAGNYFITLRAESKYGCIDKKTLEQPVEVLPEGDIVFPTAFSPTSPIAVNRVFKPKYDGEVVEYQLQIYNRWGQLIFQSKDINVGWDGKINGTLAPQDVYAYKYHVKFRSGKIKDGSGSVTLLR